MSIPAMLVEVIVRLGYAIKRIRDMEYGSARWGTEADIKPFVAPKFENNIILTGTECDVYK